METKKRLFDFKSMSYQTGIPEEDIQICLCICSPGQTKEVILATIIDLSKNEKDNEDALMDAWTAFHGAVLNELHRANSKEEVLALAKYFQETDFNFESIFVQPVLIKLSAYF